MKPWGSRHSYCLLPTAMGLESSKCSCEFTTFIGITGVGLLLQQAKLSFGAPASYTGVPETQYHFDFCSFCSCARDRGDNPYTWVSASSVANLAGVPDPDFGLILPQLFVYFHTELEDERSFFFFPMTLFYSDFERGGLFSLIFFNNVVIGCVLISASMIPSQICIVKILVPI